jgi:hypothetical protein
MTERRIAGLSLLLIDAAQPRNAGFARAVFRRAFAPLFLSGLTGLLLLVLPPYRRRD